MVLHHIKTNRNNQIGCIDGTGTNIFGAKTNRVKAIGLCVFNSTLTHKRINDADARITGKLTQIFRGALSYAAIARQNQWPFCIADFFHCQIYHFRIGHSPPITNRLHRLCIGFAFSNIFRQLHQYCTGLFTTRNSD